jgi:hypothetical protein
MNDVRQGSCKNHSRTHCMSVEALYDFTNNRAGIGFTSGTKTFLQPILTQHSYFCFVNDRKETRIRREKVGLRAQKFFKSIENYLFQNVGLTPGMALRTLTKISEPCLSQGGNIWARTHRRRATAAFVSTSIFCRSLLRTKIRTHIN